MNKKNMFLSLGLIATLSLASVVNAQQFQNSNVACEARSIVTSNTVQSITCRNYSGIADFDNSTFADCVAEDGSWAPDDSDTAILLNNGSGATCGSGTGQFAASTTYVEDNTDDSNIATAIAGPLSPGARSTVFVPFVSGGVENLVFDTPNSSGILPGTPPSITSVPIFTGGIQSGLPSSSSNRTTAVLDCNNDGFQDVVISGISSATALPSDFIILDVLTNDQAGSFTLTEDSVLDATGASVPSHSLAVGDFDGDGIPDVAVAFTAKSSVNDQVVICANDGACGFTCSSAIDVVVENPGSVEALVDVSTIAAGDFDGDLRVDIVIGYNNSDAVPFHGVQYYFNQGSNTFSSPTSVSVSNAVINQFPENITTGFYNNDSILDVAVTMPGERETSGAVYVLNSNGTGGINTPLQLNLNTDPVATVATEVGSLDSANFDHQGCDDIAALGTQDVNQVATRSAYIFMNTVESLTVSAGSTYTGIITTPVDLTGTCTLVPEDTTTTASSIVPTWTIVGSPAGASLSGAATLTPTFTASLAGTYTVQLSCVNQCATAATSTTATITVLDGVLEGSGLNGCSLGNAGSVSSMLGYLSVLACMLGMYVVRRRNS